MPEKNSERLKEIENLKYETAQEMGLPLTKKKTKKLPPKQ